MKFYKRILASVHIHQLQMLWLQRVANLHKVCGFAKSSTGPWRSIKLYQNFFFPNFNFISAVFCSLQWRLENGRTRCDRFNLVGSQCQFTCDPGYDIIGSTSAVCTQSTERNAIWTAPTPACEGGENTQRFLAPGSISVDTKTSHYSSIASF